MNADLKALARKRFISLDEARAIDCPHEWTQGGRGYLCPKCGLTRWAGGKPDFEVVSPDENLRVFDEAAAQFGKKGWRLVNDVVDRHGTVFVTESAALKIHNLGHHKVGILKQLGCIIEEPKIEKVQLSVRAQNVLNNNDVTTRREAIERISKMGPSSFKVRNSGKKTIREIYEWCGMELPPAIKPKPSIQSRLKSAKEILTTLTQGDTQKAKAMAKEWLEKEETES